LQAARKAAGFETAAAAAAHFGWSVGRYRSHESGARNIPGEDVRRYAKSFKTPPATLHAPDWDTVDRLLDEARKASEVPRIEIAKRLRCARILRGLPSAAAASKILGIGTPTYLKHENGSNGINDDMAQFYAQEFRISPDWLLSGERPSGLGASVDSRIHSILRNPKPPYFIRFKKSHRQSSRPVGLLGSLQYRNIGGPISQATLAMFRLRSLTVSYSFRTPQISGMTASFPSWSTRSIRPSKDTPGFS
jgi:hypothetical protein